MIGVKVDGFIYDSKTKTLYFENESDFEAARAAFLEAGPARRVSQVKPIPALRVLGNGKVLIRGKYLKCSVNQREFLRCLESGRCSRLDALNAVYTQTDQMTRLADPERSMYELRYGLNKKLERFRLFIDMDPTEFILQEY